MIVATSVYGYPKIGDNRELKKAVEEFWKGNISKDQLIGQTSQLNIERVKKCIDTGIDSIASNDFSLYDFMLDISTMLGVIPARFKGIDDNLALYFAMGRGSDDTPACEMTKWFDTNYHYIVPELTGDFKLLTNRPLLSYRFAYNEFGINTRPVMVGPFTYIALSKLICSSGQSVKAGRSGQFERLVLELARIYNTILKQLQDEGVGVVQLDEPALVLDRTDEDISVLIDAYQIVTAGLSSLEVNVQTYYESLSHYQRVVTELPVNAIGLDFVSNNDNLDNIKKYGFPADKKLIAGVVSGRDPWKTDFKQTVELIKRIGTASGKDDLLICNAAPLFHLPCSLKPERGHLDDNVIKLLSFADERLEELRIIKSHINHGAPLPDQNLNSIRMLFMNSTVKRRMESVDQSAIDRPEPFAIRYKKQIERFNLPLFPTTTIGSFPQTKQVRKARADWRAGRITQAQYDEFIKSSIRDVIKLQEDLDIDVLVHGEFERTDMVEFFGQKMDGFAFTKNGWVQSYGSRCVRPPIIYGDVSRPEKMTVDEVVYAQTLTGRPVKGMLTGPITITNWSFYRRDIPKEDVVYQIALALNDEVLDLERAGIYIIQIDEPAFREAVPLKRTKQAHYFKWAVNAFKLSCIGVKQDTQIHTHMCYAEFNEIIEHILAMDSDVISMEASRSKGELIEVFEQFNYDHGIGVGVYDIHSPRVASVEEMMEIAQRSVKVIDKSLFWINPDCGLKTRGYEETISALKNMVTVAKQMRAQFQ